MTMDKNSEGCAHDGCELAHKAGKALRLVIDQATDEAQDLAEATMKEVQARPVRSSVIALGIGLVAGLLLRRK